MLTFKKILLFILLFNFQRLFGQPFKPDWKDFAVKNWAIDLSSNTSMFLETFSPVGRIEIKSNNDSTLIIRFVVFDKSVAKTSKFKKQIHNWLVIQSCTSIRQENIESFFHGNYFYFIEPCDNCFSATKDNSDCNDVTRYIKSNYIEKL